MPCLAPATGGVAQELASAAVAEVLVAEHAALDPYTPDALRGRAAGALIESTVADLRPAAAHVSDA